MARSAVGLELCHELRNFLPRLSSPSRGTIVRSPPPANIFQNNSEHLEFQVFPMLLFRSRTYQVSIYVLGGWRQAKIEAAGFSNHA